MVVIMGENLQFFILWILAEESKICYTTSQIVQVYSDGVLNFALLLDL